MKMRLFCQCDSDWIIENILETKQQIINPSLIQCPICNYNYWYEAAYENMMFDLKRMNEA